VVEHGKPPDDPAAEAERTWTPRTPLRALSGVWLSVEATVVVVLILIVLALSLA
jgi:hypothetical protein